LEAFIIVPPPRGSSRRQERIGLGGLVEALGLDRAVSGPARHGGALEIAVELELLTLGAAYDVKVRGVAREHDRALLFLRSGC
jgi:hypothetical protein